MKISLVKLANSVSILDKLKRQSDDFRVSYWIMRNIKKLSDSYNFFVQMREDIYDKYCYKIFSKDFPNGTYYTVQEDNGSIIFNLKGGFDLKNFNDEMNALMNMPCDEIQPYLLNLEIIKSIKNISLSVDEMFEIDYLLSE